MAKAQHNAYIKQMHRYDALMTGRSWWGHLFMNGLWQVDQLQMAAEVLAMIPDDFAGSRACMDLLHRKVIPLY